MLDFEYELCNIFVFKIVEIKYKSLVMNKIFMTFFLIFWLIFTNVINITLISIDFLLFDWLPSDTGHA